MLLPRDKGFVHPSASEITPQSAFETRREWLLRIARRGAAAAGASVVGTTLHAQSTAAAKAPALPGTRSAVMIPCSPFVAGRMTEAPAALR